MVQWVIISWGGAPPPFPSRQGHRRRTPRSVSPGVTEGQRAAPWEKRRSWSFGNCAAVAGAALPRPAGVSAAAVDFCGVSATQGGGCPRAEAPAAGGGSLLRWGPPASESCCEMSWSKAAAMAGLMSWLGWAAHPACWAFPRGADGGGPGGEGGRCSPEGGIWLTPSCFFFDVAPPEEDKQDRGRNIRHEGLTCWVSVCPICTITQSLTRLPVQSAFTESQTAFVTLLAWQLHNVDIPSFTTRGRAEDSKCIT